jgi:hypothetical protein
MPDVNLNVRFPNQIVTDVVSPTYNQATNVYIPGPQGLSGEQGIAGINAKINGITGSSLTITGIDGINVVSGNIDLLYISGNSGYFQSAVNSLTTNLESTGNNLYRLLTGFSGNLDSNYATDLQLYNTGSTLDNKINSLSGATVTNLALTGNTLNTRINSLSGSAVLLYGDQDITGNKTLSGSFYIGGQGHEQSAISIRRINGINKILNLRDVNGENGFLIQGDVGTDLLISMGDVDGAYNNSTASFNQNSSLFLLQNSNLEVNGNINLTANQLIVGLSISFAQPNDSPALVVDNIDTDLSIARSTAGAIYNAALEGSWNGATPLGTQWNNDGWGDLSNITSRTYVDLYDIWGGGQIGSNIVGEELVMHDTINDKYYKIMFSNWQQGGAAGAGAGFAYDRELVYFGTTISGVARFNDRTYFSDNVAFDNRPKVNGTGVLLVGEAGQVPDTLVQTSGTQTISGSKTFSAATTFSAPVSVTSNLTVSQTGIFSSMDVSVDEMSISGLNLTLTSGNLILAGPTGIPSTTGASGVLGTIVWNTGFLYVCTDTNSWRRAALSTW